MSPTIETGNISQAPLLHLSQRNHIACWPLGIISDRQQSNDIYVLLGLQINMNKQVKYFSAQKL